MGWIEEKYPVGVVIAAPHPYTNKVEWARVVNHVFGPVQSNQDGPKFVQGVIVQHPDGNFQEIDGAFLAEDGSDSVLSQVMSLNEISGVLRLSYDTLAKAAREGRLQARESKAADKSKGVWLSTIAAVQAAVKTGTIRPRNR